MPSKSLRRLRWILPLAILSAIVLGHSLWLRALGEFLVKADPPDKAELIVVLAGDEHGLRILKAAELVKQGFAPKILMSGPECCYGNIESELAIAFAVKHGYPAGWFISAPHKAKSTRQEARVLVPELERMGVRRFMIVTSNYHTRRAAWIFGRVVPRDRFRVVAAPDKYFRPEDWWRGREAQKTLFFEWSKTVATWLGY